MNEQQMARKAYLLSKGDLLVPLRFPTHPGTAGDPYMSTNGLPGHTYVLERQRLKGEGTLTWETAPDPDGLLHQAASQIRWSRFNHPKYDQDSWFPVTRRLAYLAFPDLRPKNHGQQQTRR